jgi:hypothetical protein
LSSLTELPRNCSIFSILTSIRSNWWSMGWNWQSITSQRCFISSKWWFIMSNLWSIRSKHLSHDLQSTLVKTCAGNNHHSSNAHSLELIVGVVKKKKRYREWLQPLHKDQGQMPFSIVGPYCNDKT